MSCREHQGEAKAAKRKAAAIIGPRHARLPSQIEYVRPSDVGVKMAGEGFASRHIIYLPARSQQEARHVRPYAHRARVNLVVASWRRRDFTHFGQYRARQKCSALFEMGRRAFLNA